MARYAEHLVSALPKDTIAETLAINKYLLGDGGVWSDIVGTPVVGVTWLGNWVPCDKLRFNWGVLLLIPLIGRPSAPIEKKFRGVEIHSDPEQSLSHQVWMETIYADNLKKCKDCRKVQCKMKSLLAYYKPSYLTHSPNSCQTWERLLTKFLFKSLTKFSFLWDVLWIEQGELWFCWRGRGNLHI